MNLFFIDKCPIKSAQQLCDKHVVKMVLETAQMCSTALDDYVEAYRAYDRKDKAHILQWTGRPEPDWIRC